MNYEESIEFLYKQLPMFSAKGASAYKPGLDTILQLMEALGNPHQKIKTIHIAGTNGKGSVSHILAATFQKAGYKIGLYTSPHLVDLRERIRINGIPIDKEFVVKFVCDTQHLIPKLQPSYFEMNVAMAFEAFAEAKVDIAIIETGLGGRLDSTNIITPELSIITNISFDHMNVLGDTLPKIAYEKAGIIKDNVPVVIGETQKEIETVFFTKAIQHKSPIVYADTIWDIVKTDDTFALQHLKAIDKIHHKMYSIATDLLGSYQLNNIKTALTAIGILEQKGWKVSVDVMIDALKNVKRTTGLRGRWDIIQQHPYIVLDVGHNPAGIEFAMNNLKKLQEHNNDGKVHIVCGFVSDKDVSKVLSLMSKEATFYFTKANVPRAMPVDELNEKAKHFNLHGEVFTSVQSAIEQALNKVKENDILLITGSFFIVGEALTYLEAIQYKSFLI